MIQPSKIVCVGRNYAAHASELGNDVPKQPLLFLKPPSALIRSGESIQLPGQSQQVEHEAEIGILVGKTLRDASADEALDAVDGILCVNDVTARDLQRSDSQWTRAKGFDTFCPVGDPVRLPNSELLKLEVICKVNGEVRQHGHARDMVFGFGDILSFISRIMTLVPGDLVATGTPEGVGALHVGDVVDVEIPGVGVLRNPVATRSP